MFHKLTLREIRLAIAGAIILFIIPVFVREPYFIHLLILCMLYSIFALGWNLVTGYAGMKTFGHHAFFGFGAYVSALLSMHSGISPWITMWVGALIATVVGVAVGISVLRIRSVPHVAIVTLATAEIVRILIANFKDLTRGELSLWGYPLYEGFSLPLIGEVVFSASQRIPYYYLILVLFVLAIIANYLISRSKIGLALVMLRESEDAAASLGLNLTRYKLIVFGISAFMVGTCGAFYAHYIGVLTPTATVGIDLMILIVAMVLVGGLGTLGGPIIGAFVLTLGVESMRVLGEYRMLIYGAMIMGCVMFLPNGLVSAKNWPGSTTIRKWLKGGDRSFSNEDTGQNGMGGSLQDLEKA